MKYKTFTYPVNDDGECRELNSFLSSHRILNVTHHLGCNGGCLVFVVEFLDGEISAHGSKAPRVDYREKLTEDQFAVFSQLRDVRKRLADAESVPVYNVFTNAQLAEIVEKKITTESALRKVAGVGKSRVDKYGDKILEVSRGCHNAVDQDIKP